MFYTYPAATPLGIVTCRVSRGNVQQYVAVVPGTLYTYLVELFRAAGMRHDNLSKVKCTYMQAVFLFWISLVGACPALELVAT